MDRHSLTIWKGFKKFEEKFGPDSNQTPFKNKCTILASLLNNTDTTTKFFYITK